MWRNGSVMVFQTIGESSNLSVRAIDDWSVLNYTNSMPYKDPDEQRAAHRAHRLRKRQRCVDYLGGVCAVCGRPDDLEFHHIDPSRKEFNIDHWLNRRWDILRAEVDKCELRCDEHHKIAHAAAHGETLYHHGCRCAICRAAYQASHNPYQRQYRARKKAEDPFFRRKRLVADIPE